MMKTKSPWKYAAICVNLYNMNISKIQQLAGVTLLSIASICSSALATSKPSSIATTTSINQDVASFPHDAVIFTKNANPKTTDLTQLKPVLRKQYLQHYFSPWEQPFLFHSAQSIKDTEKAVIQAYLKEPGWLENKQKNNIAAIKTVAKNMHLSAFPNLKTHGIIVRNTNLRALPSNQPIFGDAHQAGQGYPFDLIQISLLKANLPVYILQTTRDGTWKLVSTGFNSFGWINSLDVADVSPTLMQRWQHAPQYIIAHQDNVPLFNKHQQYNLSSRIGELWPLQKTSQHYYWVLSATRDNNDQAQANTVRIRKSAASPFPMTATTTNIATLINAMLDTPYGWGELDSYRDCSATTKDLFSVFGFWLSRNSGDQAHLSGHFIDLEGKTPQQKRALIRQQGIPFFTLIWLHGHIMVYLGEYHQQLWAFHSPWGLHTENAKTHHDGRAVIGRAIITPIKLGSHYSNVPQSFIDKISGITILIPPQTNITKT